MRPCGEGSPSPQLPVLLLLLLANVQAALSICCVCVLVRQMLTAGLKDTFLRWCCLLIDCCL